MITVATVVLAFVATAPARAAEKRPPNVIVFLCDDVGYAEFGFQGGKDVPTPNIDSIAKNGIRFTAGYVSGPYCSPTRAGLLTGRYQQRFGHEWNEGPAAPNGGRKFGLPVEEKTIADRARALGYATAAVGKWHLGAGPEFVATARGFDEFYGTVANSPFYNPPRFIDSRVSAEAGPIKDDKFYTTDAYAERAVDWIGKQKEKPYLLYFPFNAQHAPLQAPKKYLERFPGIQDEKRKLFAAMMSSMDDAVGRVLEKVRETGQEENTLIFFLSDNGGPTEVTTSRNDPLRGFKATTLEGGVRVPFCVQWKGTLPAGKTYDKPVIQLDILPTVLAAAGGTADPASKLDGVNLLPYLTGKDEGKPHDALFWRFGEQWAVRKGDYKLVVNRIDGVKQPAALYNLKDDIGEAKDLAAKEPEKAKELRTAWEQWDSQNIPARWIAQPGKKKQQRQQKKQGAAAAVEPTPAN
jgi:arylsulfatase A-like enzyme